MCHGHRHRRAILCSSRLTYYLRRFNKQKENYMKNFVLVVSLLLTSVGAWAQYSNANLNGSMTGMGVSSGTAAFDGAGNVTLTETNSGQENVTGSANTTSVTWNSSC